MSRSSTTLSHEDPGRAATLGRIGAATRWQATLGTDERRRQTQAMRDARSAARLERARAKAASLGFEALSPVELANLQNAIEQERVARLQLASSDAARRRRTAVPS